jgi:type VI protein secretion system component Hcp
MRPNLINRSGSAWPYAAVFCLTGASAKAEFSAWLDFNGTIPGESQSLSHKNWIEIQGFRLGGKLNSLKPGSLGLTKRVDRASPKLYLGCAQGTPYTTVTLDLKLSSPVTKENPGPARIELQDVRVSSNEISYSGEATEETLELVFGRIVYTYLKDDISQPLIANYDFRSQTGSEGVGTNPDTDGDGLPDAWEAAYGLVVGINDANADKDGDGLTNIQEYQLGTNPKSSTSTFKASLVPVTGSSGTFQLSWNSVVGKTYVVEWSPDLSTPFATLRIVTAAAAISTENIVNTGNLGFYRIRPQ